MHNDCIGRKSTWVLRKWDKGCECPLSQNDGDGATQRVSVLEDQPRVSMNGGILLSETFTARAILSWHHFCDGMICI